MEELYGWGDITREQYLAERETIHRQLKALIPMEEQSKNLGKLAQFLANVADAWDEANQEQRNKLAHCLFFEVWRKDKEVVAVKPQSELKLFFDLNYEAMQEKLSQNFGKWRPRELAFGLHYFAQLLPIEFKKRLKLWPGLSGDHVPVLKPYLLK